MKAQAVGDRIVVKPIDLEDKTESGIILYRPDNNDPDQGEVVAVGDGTKTSKGNWIPSSLKLGDRIVYNKGTGTKLKLDGEDIVVLKEEEILGLVE
jgi:chaperonin GroES